MTPSLAREALLERALAVRGPCGCRTCEWLADASLVALDWRDGRLAPGTTVDVDQLERRGDGVDPSVRDWALRVLRELTA